MGYPSGHRFQSYLPPLSLKAISQPWIALSNKKKWNTPLCHYLCSYQFGLTSIYITPLCFYVSSPFSYIISKIPTIYTCLMIPIALWQNPHDSPLPLQIIIWFCYSEHANGTKSKSMQNLLRKCILPYNFYDFPRTLQSKQSTEWTVTWFSKQKFYFLYWHIILYGI